MRNICWEQKNKKKKKKKANKQKEEEEEEEEEEDKGITWEFNLPGQVGYMDPSFWESIGLWPQCFPQREAAQLFGAGARAALVSASPILDNDDHES